MLEFLGGEEMQILDLLNEPVVMGQFRTWEDDSPMPHVVVVWQNRWDNSWPNRSADVEFVVFRGSERECRVGDAAWAEAWKAAKGEEWSASEACARIAALSPTLPS